jgi:uncharacterized protein (DUF58 family)
VLTRQGGLVTAGSVALVLAGRLFGIFELFVVGAGGVALVLVAAGAVGLIRVRLDVARELRPPRAHAGTPSTVELRVDNAGGRRSPLLQLRDAVGAEGRSASVVLAPLDPGGTATATYSLPTDRRGVLAVGPLEVRISDPFGLATVSTPGAPVSELMVWPAVEDVAPLPPIAGDEHHDGGGLGLAHSTTVEDFYALRDYAEGDDLRRVHWRATAKRDDLVVRQDETPRRSRATVVLDTRAAAYGDETFERAVSAAASVVLACARAGLLSRLMTPAGYDSGFGADAEHVEVVMDHLATVEAGGGQRLDEVLACLDRAAGAGPVAVITGARASGLVPEPERGGTVASDATVVVFSTGAGLPAGAGAGGPVVVDDRTSFAAAWNRALAPAGDLAGTPSAGSASSSVAATSGPPR